MDTVGQLWDNLVASARQRASTTPTRARSQLALHLLAEPQPSPDWPLQERRLDQIDDTLRGELRAAVTGDRAWPLFVYGPAGTGKTSAALCLLDYVAGLREYHTASGLANRLIQAMHGRLIVRGQSGSSTLYPEDVWKRIHRANLVVLDELATRRTVSDHQYEVVKECIDSRQGKPLIVIANGTLMEIAVLFDDRIASRLAAGTVVHLEGEDRRLNA